MSEFERGWRMAIEAAARHLMQMVRDRDFEYVGDVERPTQVCHDDAAATLSRAAREVVAMRDYSPTGIDLDAHHPSEHVAGSMRSLRQPTQQWHRPTCPIWNERRGNTCDGKCGDSQPGERAASDVLRERETKR